VQVVRIYESAKQSSLLCSVQTYTEALDACVKSKNLAGVTRIMEDMRMAGCSPNAVTCSVVLVALGSKCSNVDEAHLLLTCLQGFDSILVHCCRNLLVLPKSDNEVSELMGDIFRTIKKEDVKTWTVLSSSLMDALWALGWYRRAALVLAWVYQRNLYDGLTVLAQSEWKLDVRRLSTGGALVTFYQWLAHLLQVVHQVDLIVYSHHAGRLPQNSDLDSESTQIDRTEIDSLFQVEVLVPLFPLNLHELENRGVVSLTKDSEDKQKLLFPSLVTVVTGWGKLSKEEGSSQVRDGVEREIMKLGVPLRASYDAGRWTAKSEALIRWLLRPETAARLVLWDIPAETPH
jgi:pentatricopeptide repeat protein